MRPFVIGAAILVATSVGLPSRAAAQDPPPPQNPPPQDVAVPRGSSAPPSTAPAASQERRGSVRAPERAGERPERVEAAQEPQPASRAVVKEEVAAPRSAPPNADANTVADEQGQRRGSVRQPPTDPASRTYDRAVPRNEVPPTRTTVVHSYPYHDPHYSRYYDPWGYGYFGLGYFYYSPWAWGPYGYPGYYPSYGPAYGYYDAGRVRLKVQPRDAEVWVDGYYAGTVDDFDGKFQSLRLDSGGYRIEVRKPGFETVTFDVRVQPDRTVTFRGAMKPLP